MTHLTNLMAAGLGALLCGISVRVSSVDVAQAEPVAAERAPDTATVRLHISGMTCGSCSLTARVALKNIPGVLDATVTLDDSLGVVRYDPGKVSPAQIAAQLTRRTGYPARILADSSRAEPAGSPTPPSTEPWAPRW